MVSWNFISGKEKESVSHHREPSLVAHDKEEKYYSFPLTTRGLRKSTNRPTLKKSYLIHFYGALGEARLRARKNDLCDFSKNFALPRDHM